MAIKRITVSKSDEATLIVEKMFDADAKEVVLTVPRFSKLAESSTNFRLLRREADALGKQIIVESVDDAVIELAKASGIECRNPFFADSARHLSDITPGAKPRRVEPKGKHSSHGKESEHSAKPERRGEERIFSSPQSASRRPIRFRFGGRTLFAAAGGILAILFIFGIVVNVLPRASITVVAAKTEWVYGDAVVVDTGVGAILPADRKIPGERFLDQKNFDLSFPASGKGKVERYAKGRIIIWNTHGSAPQPLVERTRFLTPNGKIFRLVSRVVVPGANVTQGKIIPSSIEAEVVADKPGEAYNLPPVARFSIPGFSGTAKAQTFYAESKAPIQGGFVGESAYPTVDDVKRAKETALNSLEESMHLVLAAQLDKDFRLVPGAVAFNVLAQKVNEATDAEGKFSVFTEAEISAMVFRESDLLKLMSELLTLQAGAGFEVRDYELTYGTPKFEGKRLILPVNYRSVLAKRVSPDDLRQRIAGKSETDLRATIFSLAGIESATISLWPFWVSKVPEDLEKIAITIK